MFDREIRWFALIPVSLLLGIAALYAELSGVWGGLPVRPDWFWCLAFYAALGTPPLSALPAFAWCGLARDLVLGPKMGASTLAFIIVGWVSLYWMPLAADRSWLFRSVLAGAGGFLVSLMKHSLDLGWLAGSVGERIFTLAVGDGLLTAFALIPSVMVFALPSCRPWRPWNGY